MIQPVFRNAAMVILLTCIGFSVHAQSASQAAIVKEIEKPSKPYRIFTSGKQVTIKSTKEIKSLMVWSSGGNRILEQKNINASQYNFRITIKDRIFFMMIQLADGKTYSEKLGIQ